MDVLPPRKQQGLLRDNDPHGPANLGAGHALGPNQLGASVGAPQIDLGLTVTKDVHVRRLVIIDEDDHPQPTGKKNGDHPQITYHDGFFNPPPKTTADPTRSADAGWSRSGGHH